MIQLMKFLKPNHSNLKTDVSDTLTSFFLDLVLLTLRFLLLTPVPAALPFLAIEEDVFLRLTFLRLPVPTIIKVVSHHKHITMSAS